MAEKSKKSNSRSGAQKNNYQDRSEEREYNKGYRAGKNGGGNRRKGGKKRPFNGKENFPDDVYRDKGAIAPVMAGKMMNDASWHIPSEALKAAAEVSTYYATGETLVLPRVSNDASATIGIGEVGQFNIPGIMSIDILPTFGNAKAPQDPVNVAGNLIMTYLQQKTGRAPSYDAANLQMYLQAVSSAYDYYSYMCRCYGLMRSIDLQNRYLPRVISISQNVNFTDVMRSMADFRNYINLFAFRLASLPLPNVYTYSRMTNQMYTNVYKDSDSAKAQLYMFNPAGFWQYKEGVESSPVPYLQFFSLQSFLGASTEDILSNPSQGFGVTKFQAYGEQLLQPLLLSGDIRMMATDILNSFGDSLFTVNPIAETYEVVPVYSEEIMMQIENAFIYGIDMTKSVFKLTENTSLHGGWIQSDYAIVLKSTENSSTAAYKTFNGWLDKVTNTTIPLNWHFNRAMTPEDVIVATRLSGTGVDGYNPPAGSGEGAFTSFRGQAYLICTNARIAYLAAPRSANISYRSFDSLNAFDYASGVPGLLSVATLVTLLSKFDWHPAVRISPYTIDGSLMTVNSSDYIMDIDNFVILGEHQLTNINNVCQIGDFYPRGLGGYSPVK